MTYKEKKLKEFEEFTQAMFPSPKELEIIDLCKELFSSTIDEILTCLPEERKCKIDVSPTPDIYNFNACREEFFLNLDQKAGGV